ncbi:MTH1187 family thiamine-binding protein [Pseudalkalibacillus berkeleyi]|uniref:MTH1187 family thiamine-binding protein n=1 Tax=Pseudalkalibacillus berkeleyi TaxID=1069813 RepID=A0ABS9H1R8_9BACL|nr:MTH1187 family thiamine-binding protein [Pseudalkalibacillus berkeleyi]MCF6137895.1 MTH1187 family thiamine-binding protein [Pseudalkalibacillus berkeleyi]
MAIVDITVIPIGTKSPSVSDYVVEVQKVLEENKDKINYELTPMSTLIEGEMDDLLHVIKQVHEVPFNHGIERVATNIRIDDRRDKKVRMTDKVNTIQAKLRR